MAILSNVDIIDEVNSGSISIGPRPKNIGPISLDLTVDKISELDVGPNFRNLFQGLYAGEFECYKFKDVADSIRWKIKHPETCNDGYVLRKNHWYKVKHKERIHSDDFDTELVKRSTAARRGLYQLAGSVEEDTPTEIVVPFISNIIKKDESISQVVFKEPCTRRLTFKELGRLTERDFAGVNNGKVTRFDLVATAPGFDVKELEGEIANIGLTLHPVVKYFNDTNSENGILYSKDNFLETDLCENSVPTSCGHIKFFTLAKSNEKVRIGSNYVGELLRAAPTPFVPPVNWGDAAAQLLTKQYIHATVTNCSAPYVQPGSEGHVIFEIPPGSAIQPYTTMILRLIPVRTPGKSYNNRLNKTGEIFVP